MISRSIYLKVAYNSIIKIYLLTQWETVDERDTNSEKEEVTFELRESFCKEVRFKLDHQG